MKLRFEIELEQLEVMASLEKVLDKIMEPENLERIIGWILGYKEAEGLKKEKKPNV